MTKAKELLREEALWRSLEDTQIMRDIAVKGKFIDEAMKFLSERNRDTIEQTKDKFYEIYENMVFMYTDGDNIQQAIQILENVEENKRHFLYNLYQTTKDENVKLRVYSYLSENVSDFVNEEVLMKGHHTCYHLLTLNPIKYCRFLDALNMMVKRTILTIETCPRLKFGKYMQQPLQWRKELSVEIFLKSINDPKGLNLMPILDKKCFFDHILRHEMKRILKIWLDEQYLCKAGKQIESTIPSISTFENALLALFRKWTFDQPMMNIIFTRLGEVVKNDFAKLGFFIARDYEIVRRKLNRFFTTHTFEENYRTLDEYEVTQCVLENHLIDLLYERFAGYGFISAFVNSMRGNNYKSYSELWLYKEINGFLSDQINLFEFVDKMNTTTKYFRLVIGSKYKPSDTERFMKQIVDPDIQTLHNITDACVFVKNLLIKLNRQEVLPTVEQMLCDFHFIRADDIRDEFEVKSKDFIPNFNDKKLAEMYGEKVELDHFEFIKKYQGHYATYIFMIDSLKTKLSFSKRDIFNGCEEIVKFAVNNYQNVCLVNHSIAFLETFSIDTRNLRCHIRLLKIKEATGNSEEMMHQELKITANYEDIKNIQALETFWKVKKCQHPERAYLNVFTENGDWFKIIILAQYFNYSLDEFIAICEHRLKDKLLCDNLIRAVAYEAPATQIKASKTKQPAEVEKVTISNEKFLDFKHDLFAILLKCNENDSRLELPFEQFQKMFQKVSECKDLLHEAISYNWPLLAVLAATTKLYRYKYCWLTWMILNSNFKWKEKLETVDELAVKVFEHCLRLGFIKTLDDSMQIFYPEAPMKLFTGLLLQTKHGSLKSMDSKLKILIAKLNELEYRSQLVKGKQQVITFIIRCIIIHFKYNIKFHAQQQEYLACVHRSKIGEFDGKVNFNFLQNLCRILHQTSIDADFELLYGDAEKTSKELDRIRDELIKNNNFEGAIEIATLTLKPKTDFVFKFWLHLRETDIQKQIPFDIAKYKKYMELYEIGIDVFIKFLHIVINKMDDCVEKYTIMIFILRNMIRSDLYKLDQMELKVVKLYLRLKAAEIQDIKPLTSLYYEKYIKSEKSLIHNSLNELKVIAMTDNIGFKERIRMPKEISALEKLILHLLDINDFVQVLRLERMFTFAPEDLNILIYMLSLSEGLSSIYDIARPEREMISNYGMMANRLSRFTLRSLRNNLLETRALNASMISANVSFSGMIEESSQYSDNKETLQALCGLAYKLKNGIKYGHRIVLIYRISLFVQGYTFEKLMKIKSSFEFLEIVANLENCDNKLVVMSDVIEAMQMTRQEVAMFVSKEITLCVIQAQFLQSQCDEEINGNVAAAVAPPVGQFFDNIWGLRLSQELHLILELCKGNTTLLGNYLIKFYHAFTVAPAKFPLKIVSTDADTLALCHELNKSIMPQEIKNQINIRVELIVIAHECYCLECSTEGIGQVLYLSKLLIDDLARAENYQPIVRLLCGIGRYREMFYCFDLLVRNDAFEALLGPGTDKESSNGLKYAVFSYLKEFHPNNIEYFKMFASHFAMHTELGKTYRAMALTNIGNIIKNDQFLVTKNVKMLTNQIQQIDVPYLRCSNENLAILDVALKEMIHAVTMVNADGKNDLMLKYQAFCELIAMQIHLMKIGIEEESQTCPCVLYQEQNREKLQLIVQYFASYELTIPQTLILNKNVETSIDYTRVVFCRLMNGDEQFVQDYIANMDISDTMIENIFKLAKMEVIPEEQEKILHELCMLIKDVGLKFRLASIMGFKIIPQQLLNDEQSYYYLLDSKYGAVDIYH